MDAPLHLFGAFGSRGAVVAGLGIGVLFGWFLERGGLGSARKLAGQFYLRDLTVFRVLFTALVTAMLGMFWLARAGVLDPRLLEVPATFLVPMAVGGLVFGIGFVLGGLCPGTSCVAASSGRIDGMLVMVGMLGGVLLFMELHPWLEGFHNSTPRGIATLPSLVGAAPGAVVLAVTVAALGGFHVAERIQRTEPGAARRPLVIVALVLGAAAASPLGTEVPWAGVRSGTDTVEPLALARSIRAGDHDVRVVDVRPGDAYRAFHLPLAENVPLHRLARAGFEPGDRVVVYGFDDEDGRRAQVLLERRGIDGVRVLDGGARAWLLDVMMPRRPAAASPDARERFRETAEISRYFGGAPGLAADTVLDMASILDEARRATCGW